MKDKYKRILSYVLVPVILGGIVGALTVPNSNIKSIIPMWIFPVVWTILYVLVPVILGGIVGALTVPNSDIKSIIPMWIFPVVWTILYVLMGYSAYRFNEKEGYVPRIYVIQLVVNLLWSFIFFKFKWFTFAFIWLIFLFILVIKMIIDFRKIDKTAGNLQIPYAVWLVVAAVLNIMQIIK